jgi:hypothetical protein
MMHTDHLLPISAAVPTAQKLTCEPEDEGLTRWALGTCAASCAVRPACLALPAELIFLCFGVGLMPNMGNSVCV